MKFFSSLMLKNFSSHLTWKLSWTPFHKIMVSIISMNVNKTKLPATKWFTIYKCTAGYETWFMGATLIEIGVYRLALYE